MAYADQFDRADILDSLSWTAMSPSLRNRKLAYLYIKNERELSRWSRRYEGPTKGTVGPFVKSLYSPPRGTIGSTIEAVLKEIKRQKALKDKRKGNRPFKRQKRTLRERRNALARTRYTVTAKDWRGEARVVDPKCVAAGAVGDTFLMVDSGYGTSSRIYMLHKPSNKVKVVVLEGDSVKSMTGALCKLAPKLCLRSMFGGKSIRFDFIAEAFEVEGQLVPWRNVRKIYVGPKQAHATVARPKKD